MNLKKFIELPFLKKIEWIVQYYGVWILVTIVGVCVIISLCRALFFPKPICDVCVIIISDDFSRNDIDRLEEEMSSVTGGSTQVEIYNPSEAYGDGAYTIKLLTDQLDIVIAPKEQTDSMLDSAYLSSAESLKGGRLYIGIPNRARVGPMLEKAIEYIKNEVEK